MLSNKHFNTIGGYYMPNELQEERKYEEMYGILDYEKNKKEGLDINSYSGGSAKKINIICPKCGEHQKLKFSYAYRKARCTKCNEVMYTRKDSLADKRPELAELWDYAKNKKEDDPKLVKNQTKKLYWFKCKKCGKSIELKPSHIKNVDLVLCDECRDDYEQENSIAEKRPELAKLWDYSKNKNKDNPKSVKNQTKKLYWFKCKECGKSIELKPSHIKNVDLVLCDECRKKYDFENSIAKKRPALVELWDYTKNGNETPETVSANSNKKYYFRCSACGKRNVYRSPNKISVRDTIFCEKCQALNQSSFRETAILYYAEQYFDDVVSRVKSPEGHEIDIYIKSLGIGINFDGYVHAVKEKRDREIHAMIRSVINKFFVVSEVMLDENEYLLYIDKNRKADNEYSKVLLDLFNRIDSTKSYDIDVVRDYQIINQIYNDYLRSIGIVITSVFDYAPELREEWDFDLNVIDPSTVAYNSTQEVYWRCSKNHSYKMAIGKRARLKCGCPYCANRKLLPGFNDLQTLLPEFVKNHWDFERNKGIIEPNEVFCFSNKLAYFNGVKELKTIGSQVRNYKRREDRKKKKNNNVEL